MRHLLAALVLLTPVGASAQQESALPDRAAFVFLDCRTRLCDFSHFRREITFVNWVRDRADADVHVLVTQQRSASGGSRLTLTLVGLGDLAGRRDTLHVYTGSTDTYDEERRELTRALSLSLVPYVWYTGTARNLALRYEPSDVETSGPMATVEPHDPWDSWVFRVRGRGSMAGESQERSWSGNIAGFANRTTEALKLDFAIYADGNRSEFDYSDSVEAIDTTYVSVRNSYGFDGVAVWSLSGHWSAGMQGKIDRISTLNWDLAARGGPAVEYNIFPYDQSTWRRLSVRYSAGVAAFNYADTTVFDEVSEIRPLHTLNVELGVQQPWGSLRGSIQALQYLHDLTRHSLSLSGGTGVRIFRGLEFNVGARFSRIKDQLYLSKQGLTAEEALLRLRARETDFRFGMDIGLSYQFGSRINNVVNPRF